MSERPAMTRAEKQRLLKAAMKRDEAARRAVDALLGGKADPSPKMPAPPGGDLSFSLLLFADASGRSAEEQYALAHRLARFGDDHGFEAIWVPERHFHSFGGAYASPAILGAALAQTTTSIRIRAGSVVLPLHHPLEVVEQWAMIDNLSGGRIDLGFASGWNPNDFATSPETYADRRAVWLERIDEVKRLWSGEALGYANGKGETVELLPLPRPVQANLNCWLTVTREDASFVEAGQRGLNVLTMLMGITYDELAAKIALYRAARREAGFDPASGRVSLALHSFVHRDMARSEAVARAPLAAYVEQGLGGHKGAMSGDQTKAIEDTKALVDFAAERYFRDGLFGGVEEATSVAERARRAGVNEIACLLDFGPSSAEIEESLPWLAELAEKVAPRGLARRVVAPAPARQRPEQSDDAIAVIGMSGRFPGAPDIDAFWQVLCRGEAKFRDPPPGRWPGDVAARRCGFIDDAELFDPLFFQISPREARGMDPHQRLFLMESWRAVEHAGLAPASLKEARGGVFAAMYNTDFVAATTLAAANGAAGEADDVTGTAHSLIANRVSFALGLRGPSEVVDTACSSGLVAVHRAMRALRGGECDFALAGGVNVILSPWRLAGLARLGLLSEDGACRAFDAAPSGQVMGEGVGVVVLKRLADAERDGDPILAVLRGSAVNHHGAGAGTVTMPEAGAQQDLIRAACADAGIAPSDLGYIESHGAGGQGDLVELAAFQDALEGATPGACRIGSLKPVIGFLEAAGGLSQLIKTILMLRHGRVPGTIAGGTPDELVDAGSACRIVHALEDWPAAPGERRRAGVHAYGLGGTSAHLVLEEYGGDRKAVAGAARSEAILLSARTPRALRALSGRLAEHLAAHPGLVLGDIAHSLQSSRDRLAERLGFIAGSVEEAVAVLRTVAGGGPTPAKPPGDSALESALHAFRNGEAVDWAALRGDAPARRINLPGQAFDLRPLPLVPAAAFERIGPVAVATDGSVEAGKQAAPSIRDGEAPASEIASLLRRILQLDVADIDLDRPLAELGVGSIQGVRLLEEVNAAFGTALAVSDLYRGTTIRALAALVANAAPKVEAMSGPARVRVAPGSGQDQAVAVIGLAGQFPGAENPEAFWRNIRAGVDSIREVPTERWDVGRFYDSTPGIDGKTACKWGGFLADPYRFDPLFFNLSPAEAEVMDPQQRLFLQACWHALEDAALPPSRLSGARCGVYVGQQGNEYLELVNGPDLADRMGQVMIGNAISMLPARVAYLLDLRGPTLAVDTACSSSLVAVHLAARALIDGGADMMLAGGVNLYLSERPYLMMSKAGMLSPSGRCQAFGEGADGMVPGEAVAVVVLKRLDDALRDGDPIRGVILASEVNQDGKSNGITAPNADAQTALELAVYERAGISPESISLVEAHGTGTPLGDPVEIAALAEAFGWHTARRSFCAIGSVKSNIGHASAAAGIAGLAKLLKALEHREIPRTLHAARANPHIDFAATPFAVAEAARPWESDGPRRAALSSFGFSGTNVHLVLEEAPARASETVLDIPVVVPLSARTPAALKRAAANLRQALTAGRPPQPTEVPASLGRVQELIATALGLDPAMIDADEPLAGLGLGPHELSLVAGAVSAEFGVARDRVGLQASPRSLSRALGEGVEVGVAATASGLRLRDVAHSLQVGREAMAQRQAFVVGSLGDLAAQLDGFLAEQPVSLPEDELGRLGQAFMAGEPVAWPEDKMARRISLPGYPFAEDSHSLPRIVPADARAAPLHPLIGRNASGFDSVRFESVFTGEEFFLADHVVGGRRLMPGAVYLEMARAAGAEALGRSVAALTHVAWLRPLVQDIAPVTVSVALERNGDGARFRIESAAGTHAEGNLTCESAPASQRVDLDAIRAVCPTARKGDDLYRFFAASGLAYGRGFKAVAQGWAGEGEALAELVLPAGLDGGGEGFLLHPSLLDAATQAVALLEPEAAGREARVPFAVERIDIAGVLPARLFAHARRAGVSGDISKFDIDLIDEHGTVLAAIRGYSARSLVRTGSDATILGATRPVLLVPRAMERPLGKGVAQGHVLAIAGTDWHAALRAQFGDRIAFRNVEELAAEGSNAADATVLFMADPDIAVGERGFALARTLAVGNGQRRFVLAHPLGGDPDAARAAALPALFATLAQERPSLAIRCVGFTDWRDREAVARRLVRELASPEDAFGEVSWRGERRESQGWEEAEWPAPAAPVYRDGGVYLITGASGGIGRIVARALAERHGARLVLLSREPVEEAFIVEIERAGGEALAIAADVSDEASLAAALDRARRRFGAIHGVFHAAGVLRDGLLQGLDKQAFATVAAPKVVGVIYLDKVLASEALDFFLLFSSSASLGNAGQGTYAYANRFLDRFAAWRDGLARAGERHGHSVAVDWSPWCDGGMRAPDETLAWLWDRLGVVPLRTDEALDVLALAASGSLAQSRILPLAGDRERILASFMDELTPAVAKPSPADTEAPGDRGQDALRYLTALLARELKLQPDQISADDRFEQYGIDSVMAMQLTRALERDLGELPKTLFFEHRTVGELAERLAASQGEALAALSGPDTIKTPAPKGARSLPAVTARPIETTAPHPAGSGRRPGEEGIAIIGLSGRFPQAENLDEFWRNLCEGRDCIEEIPDERFDWRRHYDSDPTRYGSLYAKWGGFLADVDKFDPLFFRISPREAAFMDPQERLFMETAWACVESAGIAPSSLAGRRVGVYAGTMYGEYQLLGVEETARGNVLATASFYASVANRVSHALDLAGPSLAVDTMCSSSLTAIHLACQAIRDGECGMAIAGGVNVSIHMNKFLTLSQGRFAATDGRCRSFGADGDGYVPGEGVGAVLLKPLEQARADGDIVWGVVRGSALSHGGRTSGYTVPNPVAQGSVVEDAIRRAGVEAEDIGYIEAHGTGTSLGDPIEVNGLARAFGALVKNGAKGGVPRAIGSVKSNIGHLEGAAGIAGVAKVLLQMRHGELVPTIHAETLNPNIDFGASSFAVQRESAPWHRRVRDGVERPLLAGISSFGAGGANAHVVIEEHIADLPPRAAPDGPAIVVLSAKDEERLTAAAKRLRDWIGEGGGADPWRLHDMAYTLQIGRDALPARLAFIARDMAGARVALERFLAGGGQGIHAGTVARGDGASAQDSFAGDDPDAIARAWVSGAAIDWAARYAGGSPRRIVLPTYPFARERCWIETTAPAEPLESEPAAARRVILKLDPADPLIESHKVANVAVLPGMASVALAFQAAERVWPGQTAVLTDIVWSRPLTVEAVTSATLDLAEDGEVVLRDEAGDICARGRLALQDGNSANPAPEPLTGGAVVDGYDLYTRLREGGLAYGAAHRGLRAVRVVGAEAEAELALPPGREGLARAAWLDACLHGVAALAKPEEGAAVPFALREARLRGDLPERATVRIVKRPDGEYDIDVRDPVGAAVALMRGLVLRRLSGDEPSSETRTGEEAGREAEDPLAGMIWQPRWRAEETPGRAHAEPDRADTVTILAAEPDSPLAQALAAVCPGTVIRPWSATPDKAGTVYLLPPSDPLPYRDIDIAAPGAATADLLHVLRALREGGARITVVTGKAWALGAEEQVDPVAAGLSGLARGAVRESNGRMAVIDIDPRDDAQASAALIAAEPPQREGETIMLRRGVRYRMWLDPVDLPQDRESPWRKGGHYLIVGGAGGVGQVLSLDLARRYGAKLTWIGRRARDASIDSGIAAIREAGGDAQYLAADATDTSALLTAVDRAVAGFGPLNGAIHSALVLRDGMLLRMGEAELLAAFDVKARGGIALARALEGRDLDFFAVFSSAVVFTANPGQANYAAGSAFLDALGGEIGRAGRWPVCVIDWGLWGGVGVVAGDEIQRRMAAQGVESIMPETGLVAIERALASGLPRVVTLKLAPALAAGLRHDPDVTTVSLGSASRDADLAGLDISVAAPPAENMARTREGFERLHIYARRRLAEVLADALPGPGEASEIETVRAALGVVPGRDRLFRALLDMLLREGVLREDGERLTRLPRAPLPGLKNNAETAPFQALLDACLTGLRDVLAGRAKGTDIVFPGGSQHLVEAVYRGDEIMDSYSRILADLVVGWLRRTGATTARLVEIGAGTGAATRFILAALDEAGIEADYLFTDLSPSFVERARTAFEGERTALRFKTLDIARDPRAQGFVPGEADIVIASNVLHATPAIEKTIDHAKSLLTPGGLLAINEVTAVQDFATLTFGLLDGWWAFDAGEGRLDHAPLLSAPRWRDRFAAAGFRETRAFGLPGLDEPALLQAVVAAVADGWARRREIAPPATASLARAEVARHAPPGDGPTDAMDYARRVLAKALGMKPAMIDPDAPLTDYGLDSLVMMDVERQIETDLGEAVPATLLVDAKTAGELGAWLAENRGPALQAVLKPVEDMPDPAPVSLENSLDADLLPLSRQQLWHWSLGRLVPDAPGLVAVPASFRLDGHVDRDRLQAAVNGVVARHATLRTVFVDDLDGPRQRVLERMTVPVGTEFDEGPFDIERGPLLRVALREEGGGQRLDLLFHHIVADLWSVGLFMAELSDLYAGTVPPPLRLDFKDHIAAEAERLSEAELAARRGFWAERLQGADLILDLGAGDGPSDLAAASEVARRRMPADCVARLRAGGESLGCAPFVILFAVFAAMLHGRSGARRFPLGVPVANRGRAGSERLIGDFADIRLVVPEVDPQRSGRELVAAAGEALDMAARQELPFAETAGLIRSLRADPSLLPLQACCTYTRQAGAATPIIGGAPAKPIEGNRGALAFELFLTMVESDGALDLNLEYLDTVMDGAGAGAWLARFETLLDVLLREPEAPLDRHLNAAGLIQSPALRLVSSFTAEPVAEPLAFLGTAFRMPLRLDFAPYGQVMRELLDPASAARVQRQGAVALLWRLADLAGGDARDEAEDSALLGAAERFGEFAGAVESAARRISVPLVVLRCPDRPDLEDSAQWRALQARADRRLAEYGGPVLPSVSDWHDPAAEREGHVPYTDAAFGDIALALTRRLATRLLPVHKLVVLDADNTLWNGVVGEVGPDGLTVDPAKRAFQEMLVERQRNGLLLAVVSKNEVEDVEAAFAALPDMPLRPEHLVSVKASWRAKSEAIAGLARDLGLGLESFVFVDDNPVECAEVRSRLPMVAVLPYPATESDTAGWLARLWALDTGPAGAEDRRRTQMYRENTVRTEALAESGDFRAFLESLRLEVEIRPLVEEDIARATQLTQRTNQFNTTTRRMTVETLRVRDMGTAPVYTIRVRDRFGDYGLVGLACLGVEKDVLEVETLLLSCRVLGRGVEQRVAGFLGELAVEKGVARLRFAFVPSARNRPAADFLESLPEVERERRDGEDGFALDAGAAAGTAFDVATPDPAPPAAENGTETVADAGDGPARARAFEAVTGPWRDGAGLCGALRAAAPKPARMVEARADFVAPAGGTEADIAALWREVLALPRVGAQDDFFRIGGTSLAAARMIGRLSDLVGRRLTLTDLMDSRTPAMLAKLATSTRPVDAAIIADPARRAYPLSPSQEALWSVAQAGQGGAEYAVAAGGRTARHLDPDLAREAFRRVVARHPALRTTFPEDSGDSIDDPVQVVRDEPRFDFSLHDFSTRPMAELDAAARSHAQVLARNPFDLVEGPLVRLALYDLGDDGFGCLLAAQHLVIDGTSLALVMAEFRQAYADLSEGREPAFAPLPLSPGDVALWQRAKAEAVDPDSKAFWRAALADPAPLPSLGGAENAPGGLVTGRFDGDTLRRLDSFAAAQGATPFEVMLSLWHGVLARHAGAVDICHGVPIDDRPRPEGDGLVGCFVKTLPVRLRCDLSQSFAALVGAVTESWRDARRHADPPLWRILADAGLRAAPFASFFAYQEWSGEEDTDFRPWTIDVGRSAMPVVLEILVTADGAAVRLEYGSGFADEAIARRMLDGFLTAAGEVLANPELPIESTVNLANPKNEPTRESLPLPPALTPPQRRFFDLPMENRAHWNSAVQLQVGLSFDLDRFVTAYLRIAEHCDALRTGFRRRGKAWVRESLDIAAGPVLRRGSLDGLGRKAGEELAKRLVAELQDEFDLASGHLIGFCHLTSRSKHRNRLILVAHRLILSDAAWPQLLNELDSVYRGGTPKTPPHTMPDKPSPVAAVPGDSGIAEQIEQWEDLARCGALNGLPYDRPNAADLERESDSVAILLDEEVTAALTRGVPEGPAPGEEDILVAALHAALTAWTGEDGRWLMEWECGSADAGPDSALGWHGTRHPFLLSSGDPRAVLTARRSLPNGGRDFLALRHGADRAVGRRLKACRGEISFNHLGRVGDFGAGSIFWGLFRFDIGALRDPRAVRPHALAIESAIVDNHLAIRIGFGRKRFSRAKLLRLAKAYQAALETLAAADASMPGPSPEEGIRRILAAGTGAARSLPDVPCVVDLIPWERHPDLAARAVGVFEAMAAHRGAPVAVCLPRGETLNATILGILAAGAILVSMDPAWPDARIHTILMESGAAHILTDGRVLSRLANGSVVAIDTGGLPTGDPAILRGRGDRDDTAYLMFTSGSTGRPKGAALSHRALLNHAVAIVEAFGLGPRDRVLQMAAPGFDVYFEELIPSLVAGATVVPLADGADLDPAEFLAFVAAEKLTVLNLPSAYWGLLASRLGTGIDLPSSVRLTVVGGDRVAPAAVEAWRRGTGGAPLVNAYGLTETTITTTAWIDDGRALDGAVPVGRPLANQQAHVLDDGLRPAEDDAVGMLHIGGAGLARGYWRDGELDSCLFPEIDLGAGPMRLFATGDMARRRADGVIEILGRRDDQVQLRGHRIELAEVENTLASHPEVVQASVSAQGETLVAHVAGSVEPAALLAHARRTLPAYMVPGAVYVLAALPVTPSGKIDREALAALSPKAQKPLRPRGKLEKALAELWRGALDCAAVDARRSFAEHGGHSIAALAISAQARRVLGHALPATWLMESPSLRALAKKLSAANGPSWERLGGGGEGNALHILSGISGESGVLQPLADILGGDRPVMGFDFEPMASTVEKMAEASCAALSRTESPLLGGWSLGGVVAHAAVRKFEREGRAAVGLVLIDSVLGVDLPGGSAEATLADWLMDMHGKRARDEAEARSILRDLGMRTGPGAIEALVAPWRARRAAHAAYRPSGPVQCPVAFLQASPGGGASDAAVAHWRNLAGGRFRVFPLAADHFALLEDPATAIALSDALAWIEEEDA